MDAYTIARRFAEDLWGKGDFALVDQLLAPDLVEHTGFLMPKPGLDGHKETLAHFRAAFPDWRETAEDVIVDGDLAMVRWSGTGTHQGEILGVPATGKTVTLTGMDVLRIANGKITERWAEINVFGLLQQLGVIPSA
jgi:steroid delta-isomerase-like uncharacterized protein